MVRMGHNWMSNGHKNSCVKYQKLNQIDHKCPILMSQKKIHRLCTFDRLANEIKYSRL